VRFLAGDAFLAPLGLLMIAFGLFGAGLTAGLPVYAYDAFDGSARIAGLFYAALGAGAIVGTVLAVLIVRKVQPLRLAALGSWRSRCRSG